MPFYSVPTADLASYTPTIQQLGGHVLQTSDWLPALNAARQNLGLGPVSPPPDRALVMLPEAYRGQLPPWVEQIPHETVSRLQSALLQPNIASPSNPMWVAKQAGLARRAMAWRDAMGIPGAAYWRWFMTPTGQPELRVLGSGGWLTGAQLPSWARSLEQLGPPPTWGGWRKHQRREEQVF